MERIQGKGTVVLSSTPKSSVLTIGSYEAAAVQRGLRKMMELWNKQRSISPQINLVSLGSDVPLEDAYRMFDIVFPGELSLVKVRQEGLAEPLKGRVSLKELGPPAVLENYISDLALHALPLTYSPIMTCVNTDILRKVGFRITDKVWTWDSLKDFVSKVIAFRKNSNSNISSLRASVWHYRWLPFLWQNDCDIFDSNSFENEEVREALRFYFELFTSPGVVVPSSYPGMTTESLFASGYFGLAFLGYFNISSFVDSLQFDWEVYSLPSRKRRSTAIYTVPITISRFSGYKAEAISLLQELFSIDGQLLLLKEAFFLPMRIIDTSVIQKRLGEGKALLVERFQQELAYARSLNLENDDFMKSIEQRFAHVFSGILPLEAMWEERWLQDNMKKSEKKMG